LLHVSDAGAGDCQQNVNTLADAKTYADCLKSDADRTRELLLDRIKDLESEIKAIKDQFAQTLTVNDLHVLGTSRTDKVITVGGAAQLGSYYIVGPSDNGTVGSISILTPANPPKYGREIFAWVDLLCVNRGAPPFPPVAGYAYAIAAENGAPTYGVDPKLNGWVSWSKGELFVTNRKYTDCLVSIRHSIGQ
jgi:hypothetical protein